jgi:hypothetical protein
VAVIQVAFTAPLLALPIALTIPATVVARLAAVLIAAVCTLPLEPAMLVPSALIVGARLVADPVTDVSAAFTVGARLAADPLAAVTPAFTVAATCVAAPEAVVAALPVVAVASGLLHAASRSTTASSAMGAYLTGIPLHRAASASMRAWQVPLRRRG